MRPEDPAGFRQAWQILGRRWDQTVAWARRLPPESLHESVDGEWSFIETLRHLVFATDAWVSRAIGGDPSPWHPLGLQWDEGEDMPEFRAIGPPARPSTSCSSSAATGCPPSAGARHPDRRVAGRQHHAGRRPWLAASRSFPIRECLLIVLNEEWCHRQFAERDLAALESRAS